MSFPHFGMKETQFLLKLLSNFSIDSTLNFMLCIVFYFFLFVVILLPLIPSKKRIFVSHPIGFQESNLRLHLSVSLL